MIVNREYALGARFKPICDLNRIVILGSHRLTLQKSYSSSNI
jgi:hypothetical protein